MNYSVTLIFLENYFLATQAECYHCLTNVPQTRSDSILTLQQAGLVDTWLQEQIGAVPQCLRPPSADRRDGISSLDLEAFGGLFLVLAAGKGGEGRTEGRREGKMVGMNNFEQGSFFN